MGEDVARSVSLNASGDLTAASGFLFSVNLTAGGATALAIVTDKLSGTELTRLSALSNTSAQRQFLHGIAHNGLTLTLSGAGAVCDAEL